MLDKDLLAKANKSRDEYEEAMRLIEENKVPMFAIKDGTLAIAGSWYRTKRGNLCRAESLDEDGTVFVTSHFTGNLVPVPREQVLFFTSAEEPDTECGTMLIESKESDKGTEENTSAFSTIYSKYPHVVPGSVYKVKNVASTKDEPFIRGKKTKIKGQVRCKIRCQEDGCENERDIKVQDAFQVKKCLDCRSKKKKKDLKKFLDKKSSKEVLR